MKTIGIFSRKFSAKHRNAMQKILTSIENLEGLVLIFKPLYNNIANDFNIPTFAGTFENYEELKSKAQLLISLGGDGSFLEAVSYVKDSGIPILGINIGRLGFLSSVDVSEIKPAIESIFEKKYSISKRTLIKLKSVSDHVLPVDPFAFNDITISKKDTNSMIVIHTLINNKHLSSYWADGLITATPTGSTAYSLSCNGPIVTPECNNFIITPIAPHNLSVRPLVIPDDSHLKFIVESRSKSFYLTIDSRTFSFKTGSEIEIVKENYNINLIQLPDDDFFQIIREKLHWGSDKRN